MKLFHSTKKENLKSILKKGLIPSGLGIVYLAPTLESAYKTEGRVILEVETGNNKLSSFEDCKDWEILCWGAIPPENIRVVMFCRRKAE